MDLRHWHCESQATSNIWFREPVMSENRIPSEQRPALDGQLIGHYRLSEEIGFRGLRFVDTTVGTRVNRPAAITLLPADEDTATSPFDLCQSALCLIGRTKDFLQIHARAPFRVRNGIAWHFLWFGIPDRRFSGAGPLPLVWNNTITHGNPRTEMEEPIMRDGLHSIF